MIEHVVSRVCLMSGRRGAVHNGGTHRKTSIVEEDVTLLELSETGEDALQ